MTNILTKAEAKPGTVTIVPIETTPADMIRLAIEKGADVAVLTQLFDLKLRYEADEARKAFVAALNKFKADPPGIFKNRHVSFTLKTGGRTEYDHATLSAICAAIDPKIIECGLSYRWETTQDDKCRIGVTCVVTHEFGHSEKVTLYGPPDESGGKNNIQAIGSTVTYLQRYTLLAALGLATKDQDDDGEKGGAGEPISPGQKEELIGLIKETDTDTKKFLDYMGVASLDELPASLYTKAIAALRAKKRGAK